MWIDILLAIVALVGVFYSLAGESRKKNKLTTAGKGVISAAIFALLLSIGKSISDESERNEQKVTLDLVRKELVQSNLNTERIPNLVLQIKQLQKKAENIQQASNKSSVETAKLRSAIITIFDKIRMENKQLIIKIPNKILVKDRGNTSGFNPITRIVRVDKRRVIREINMFQRKMDTLEKELISKIEGVDVLLKTLTE